MTSGMKQFYVGYPRMTGGAPPRIGDGFEARTITEARVKACEILAASDYRFGYLCHITKDSKITLHGSIREDGCWSRYLMLNRCLPMDYGDWNWKPVRKL